MSGILREQLADQKNYGGPRSAKQIRYLVFHYTGNDGDSAAGNAAYFQRNVVRASAHYFVDDMYIYRSVPELRAAWAVGGKRYANADRTGGGTLYGTVTNANSISIELCDTVKNGIYQATEATLENAAALGRELMERYHIPLERVCRHFDVTGKHCPSYFINAEKWSAFKQRLKGTGMDNAPASYAREAVSWAVERGIITGSVDGDLMLSQPVTRQQMIVMLYRYAGLEEKK